MKYNTGAVITKPGSSKENKTGSWRSMKPVVDLKKCTKCGTCWTFCPDSAIKMGKDGYPVIDYDYCKGCGICSTVCPVNAIKMEKEEK